MRWDLGQRVGKTGGPGTALETWGGGSGGDKALGQGRVGSRGTGVMGEGTHEGPACTGTVCPVGPVGVGGWLGADRGRLAQRC